MTGLLVVALAVVTGVALAGLLAVLGLTDTSPWALGPWLAGLGLLGGWRQDVTADVAGGIGWSTWAAGAPLLVTITVAVLVALLVRRLGLEPVGVLVAAAAAGAAAALLVAVSTRTTTTTSDAGTVEAVHGLTWWWTGGVRPGTVVGALLLVATVGLVHVVGRRWWDGGRGVAYGLLVVPGVLLTVAAAAGAWWLTSSTAVAVSLAALYPLLGTVLLLSLGGAPAQLGLTRITPEPVVLATWSTSPLVLVGGLVAAGAVAVLVGLVLRSRRHVGSFASGVSVSAALALVLTWAMATTVDVPDSLGGLTRLATSPVIAAGVAAGMAAIALLVRGRSGALRPPGPPGPGSPPPPPDPAGP
jgi:hypothetical protein